jgi:hypothetical protein
MIPGDLGMTLEKALKQSPDLREAYQNDDEVRYLIDMAKRLEGLPRHTSMHAAGVVIGQRAMDEFVPLSRASDGTITTQFTMTTLEELGLLKMDFLGLRTLTVIQNAVRQAEENYGVHLVMEEIDYNDKDVLASIGTGKCDGIFQLESSGMKSFMKELRPENLEDIIAGISLYRPGPMDFIPRYLKGKNDKDSITYECPQLEHILGPTYGCIVYQEQVMQIVRDLAGYTMGRSDLVRRAMSKKKAAVMEKERQNFVYGNQEENVKGCYHAANGRPGAVFHNSSSCLLIHHKIGCFGGNAVFPGFKILIHRMTTDIDAKCLLFEGQKLSLRKLRHLRHGDLVLLLFFLCRKIKKAQLTLQHIFAVLIFLIQKFRRNHGLLSPVARKRIHGTGLDEILQGTLIHLTAAHALHKIINGGKKAVILTFPDDLVHHIASNALDC